MDKQETRWKQRLLNFSKVMRHLDKALLIENPDFLQKAGIIQLFEISFELAWKLLKDYLEEQGFQDVKSPRAALKKAFEIDLIQNGHEWIELLENRNLTSHTYDETKANEVETLIETKYYPIMKDLQRTFEQKINAN
jgi:nucleotidyltransferase substrate binding protein (TIGR01987 family)